MKRFAFIDGFDWGVMDYVAAFVLIAALVVSINLLNKAKLTKTTKILGLIGAIVVFLAIWGLLATS